MAHNLRLTARDRTILAFAAEHRLVLECQLECLLVTAPGVVRKRLGALTEAGFLRSDRVFGDRHYQIRARGLAAIGSALPVPQFNLSAYRHDVGLAWLWLAAHRGTFGPLREVLSERRLRSHDGVLERAGEPYGVRLGGEDRHGKERLHYPDLLLIDPAGRRRALELELTPKGHQRRESILGGYAADPRIDSVLYLVEHQPRGRAIKRAIENTSREMGLSGRIHFQLVKPLCPGADGMRGAPQRPMRARRPAEAAR